MPKLAIQQFIEQHGDWEKLLSEKPYSLEIKRDKMFGKNLILFKYNMIDSDFSQQVVCESRGLVLDEDTNEVVVFPFTKFFNVGEPHAASIDWNTAKVTQKIDGSIIKITKAESSRLMIGTNSNIDAFKAPLAEQLGCKAKSFGELVLEGLAFYGLDEAKLASMLEMDVTYIFELTSPYNQVVVKWPETKLNFIGVRDNKTFQEGFFEDHALAKVFNTPKIYDLRSVEECIAAASELPDDEEGYVVRDASFRRIKIKSPRYLTLHRLAGNGVMSLERAIEIVRANEIDEVVAYFPNFKTVLDEVKAKCEAYASGLDKNLTKLKEWIKKSGFDREPWMIQSGGQKRKDAAMFIMSTFGKKMSGFAFTFIDGEVDCAKSWVQKMPIKSLCQAIESME